MVSRTRCIRWSIARSRETTKNSGSTVFNGKPKEPCHEFRENSREFAAEKFFPEEHRDYPGTARQGKCSLCETIPPKTGEPKFIVHLALSSSSSPSTVSRIKSPYPHPISDVPRIAMRRGLNSSYSSYFAGLRRSSTAKRSSILISAS